MRYLALTHRWRTAGLMAALTAYTVDGLQHQRIGFSILYGLGGWFAGAIGAEIRAAGPVTDRRVASLEPRTADRYVTEIARSGLWAATVLCPIATIVGALAGLSPTSWLVPLIGAAVLRPLVWVVARHVAMRPQPVDAPDLLAADETIRRNSLQVLYAAAMTLMLYLAGGPILFIFARDSVALTVLLTVLIGLGIPTMGWRVARPRRADEDGMAMAA